MGEVFTRRLPPNSAAFCATGGRKDGSANRRYLHILCVYLLYISNVCTYERRLNSYMVR